MSGGAFGYNQYRIDDIVSDIENIIKNNHVKDEDDCIRNYSEKTIKKFRIAIKALKKAAVYAQRIDWLVSNDDSEESFHKRLKEDLKNI